RLLPRGDREATVDPIWKRSYGCTCIQRLRRTPRRAVPDFKTSRGGDQPRTVTKRLLIAAGTARYAHLPADQQRPTLNAVVASLANMFTNRLQYSRALSEVSKDPTA